jgi:hypothetical protein
MMSLSTGSWKRDDVLSNNPQLDLAEFMGSLSHDPYQWVFRSFPWGHGPLEGFSGPDEWQAEQLKSITRKLKEGGSAGCVIQEAVASGHGIGKSTLISWLILWALSTCANTRGVITANTESQLKTKTWSELAKWHRLFIARAWFELTATAIFSKIKGFEKTWRIDQIAWSENNTEAFAGLHNKGGRIFLGFDEASAIPNVIWEVSEGVMTDSDTEIIWCVYGNPTRNTGRFKDCFGKFRHRWTTRHVDSRSSILTNKERIQGWVDDYGEDSDFVKVRVRGMFPAMSVKQFISTTDVDAAFGKVLHPSSYDFAPKILTLDNSWEGDDEGVIGLRQGLSFRILSTFPKNDNDVQIANVLARFEDEEQADAVFIDGGYGTGVVSAGRAMNRKNWVLVWFAEKSGEAGCVNKRAEMWAAIKKWLKEGGALPADEVLHSDLTGPETVPRLDGKIQIESKKDMKRRGLPSPGRGDALALSFAHPVKKRTNIEKIAPEGTRGTFDPIGWQPKRKVRV